MDPATDGHAAAAADTGASPAKRLKPSPAPTQPQQQPPPPQQHQQHQQPMAGVAGGYHLEGGVVSEAVMATAPQLGASYQAAKPYHHCVMHDIFEPGLLRGVRDEIINNIDATYKETDLFKVFQTGDLGNLDSLDPAAAAKLPCLNRLKKALYSDEFRAFVTSVTGCGDLSPRTDCSCNVYAHGCHLLCHDDVIANRRVSYIIYLTDPDDPWVPEDGGALELYPQLKGQEHTPAPDPSLTHLPTFNTMAMFTVTPGRGAGGREGWDVAMEYLPEDDDTEEGEGGAEGEAEAEAAEEEAEEEGAVKAAGGDE
ncbi:PKHD-type hydroxylase ofd1 [Tetrabaena socialis]|uniref:PKHD-type hydroxylase ofd1 n=1 Tax=Tetrabaena socialis TaxID=47790 RepID=A0A2J8AGI9_9CHLO|nr:PKHD-type hydroxylase ofd1 [Tetrabaena socialis]|eukprot:PNH11629.1 PKHD-type hydroxylase ofd1 [Tetrabaena socialis]